MIKFWFLAICLVIFVGSAIFYAWQSSRSIDSLKTMSKASKDLPSDKRSRTAVVAKNLDTPWAIAFLPDGSMLLTEREGKVRLIDKSGNLSTSPISELGEVKEIGEGGLLGITLHPEFILNSFVYVYYTYSENKGETLNRVVRMVYGDGKLSDEKIIVDKIPGNSNHNGGRIKFGPDGFLYIGTGDAGNPSQAQNRESYGGKILRVTESGDSAPGNPFGSIVYSYGHRNVQGLSWKDGDLWATEHGRSGVLSGLDELNFIERGKNYGWPTIQGDKTELGMETPAFNSGSDTWAPSGAAFYKDSLFFGGLRGQALYEAVVDGKKVVTIKEHFKGQFGRIRDVILGPDNMLYITTSNMDGRGNPGEDDDVIIRVDPNGL